MGILDWIKNLFTSNKERNDEWTEQNQNTTDPSIKPNKFTPDLVEIIHINPNVYLAHRGARICIGKNVDPIMTKRMTSLENIIGVKKHESVAEHTNIVILFKFYQLDISKYYEDYTEFISNLKFCHCVGKKYNSNGELLLVGGSARAFMHLIRETSPSNYFLQWVKESIYSAFEKCFFKSLIDANLLDGERCTYLCNAEVSLIESKVTQLKNDREDSSGENYDADCQYIEDPVEVQSDHVDLVYASPINEIYNKIKKYGFTLRDVYRVATVSFIFHDISRSCSHQIVRHRNGISQESQRYVKHDYTMNDFIDPIWLNRRDRYKDTKIDYIRQKLSREDIFHLYEWLIQNGVHKEDARAYLPTNVTTKLMMTMTYENYAYFLHLRMDQAAQKEIRQMAEESVQLIMDPSKVEQFIDYIITPYALKKELMTDPLLVQYDPENTEVDELISEQITEPDSMKVQSVNDAQTLLDLQTKYANISEKEI